MEIYIGLFISFSLLIFSVIKNIFIGYGLITCWFLFVLISVKKGYSIHEIGRMTYNGGKKSFIVLKTLMLIGGVIGIWMASGTIPSIVFYCLKYMTPYTFVLSAFLICSITSFLIGTSIGTVSTVGIPLIIIARNGNVNLNIVAGAIIAGAYFGDRSSPMSSSAVLVSNITKTNLFINIKNMLYSSIIPFLLTVAFYYVLSLLSPLKIVNNNLSEELLKAFNINLIMLLPALVILVLSFCKVKINFSILASMLCASILCVIFKGYHFKQIIDYIFLGYKMNNSSPLQNIIKGGGIFSMLKTCLVVFISCCLAGIFQGIKMFENLKNSLLRMELTRHKLFGVTSIVSIVTAAFGCTQSIAVIMTNEILNDCYNPSEKYKFALDLENSGILLSALIPWNIAALVPTTTMNVSATGYIPYAFYLYVLPIVYFIYVKYSNSSINVQTNNQQSET